MSVKFIRTCNRCGKVLEDIKGDDKNVVNYHGHNNVYFTITSNEHPEFSLQEYDLCEDCHKDFVQFMKGSTVLDISLRGKHVDTDNAKEILNEKFGNPNLNEDGPIYKYIKHLEREEKDPIERLIDNAKDLRERLDKDGFAIADEAGRGYVARVDLADDQENGWSPEVRELVREHNKMLQEVKAAEKKHIIDTADETASKIAETVTRNYIATGANLMDKSAIKLKPGTHTYHRWTKEEDQFILYHSAGMTMNELANKFGVTLKAVIHRKHMILNGKIHVEKEV